jgi:hypothetical protein
VGDRPNSRSTMVLDKQGKKRRQVRFKDIIDDNTFAFEGTKIDTTHDIDESLWWNQTEIKEIRENCWTVIKSVKKEDDIWTQARKYSYIETLSRVWMSCYKGDEVTIFMEQEICFWTTIGHSRRGLEKFTLSRVQAAQLEIRKQHIQEILALQKIFRERKLSYEQSVHYMRFSCEENSRATIRFSQVLAKADAFAANNDDLDFSLFKSPQRIEKYEREFE